MKCSELISELSQQMARSGDLEVVFNPQEGPEYFEIEGVTRVGDGPILICEIDFS